MILEPVFENSWFNWCKKSTSSNLAVLAHHSLDENAGVSETSSLFPGTLPQGAVVEEVQVVGNRLSFTDFSMILGGWVGLLDVGLGDDPQLGETQDGYKSRCYT